MSQPAKKIGILTFQNTVNYGAELQKYALQTALRELGADSEVIDYRCDAVERDELPGKPWEQQGFKNILKSLIRGRSHRARYRKFREFSDTHVSTSAVRYTRENLAACLGEYDRFLAGSDQVWNLEITQGDPTYLLDFVLERERKLSYAASFGYAEIPAQYRALCETYLPQFFALNVRERQGKKILDDLGRTDAQVVCDPTLLLGAAQWMSLTQDTSPRKEPYLLVYLPYYSEKVFSAIRRLARQRGLKIVYIHNSLRREYGMENLRDASPTDFLTLIRHAECIITGSFHAVCFSLLFEKEFYCTGTPHPDRNSRIRDLLELLEIGERGLLAESPQPISYETVTPLLRREADRSRTILQRIVNEH